MISTTKELTNILEKQRAAYNAVPYPSWQSRKANLLKLRAALSRYANAFEAAINEDFGHRSSFETQLTEFTVTESALKYALKHTPHLIAERPVPTALQYWPGQSKIIAQPRGVVGIISPWNYPLQLTLVPLIGALSAGNRVMIKPSELTPKTSALIKTMLAEIFDPGEVFTALGGADIAARFSALPFDHLFFTGSTAVGKKIAEAAAKNLTPVTLELGGKSPVIIDDSADLNLAAARIVSGKLLNSGQTCIAPDYILMPDEKIGAFAASLIKAAERYYPSFAGNPDYSTIISPRHFDRLNTLLQDARDKGATVFEAGTDDPSALSAQRRIPLKVLTNVTPQMKIMQEEVFGPLLPIMPAETMDAALYYVQSQDRPLALYWFGRDKSKEVRILHESHSGGVCINETAWQFVQEDLPFGGIGPSGQGAYHGPHSFNTFSHMKAVFSQSRFSQGKRLYPPYTAKTQWLLSIIKRLF